MKKIFLIIILAQLFLISCNNEDISKVTAIKIKTDNNASEILVGETFTFVVKTDTDETVTSDSTIKVDGETINGNTFFTNEISDYIIEATYNQFNSAEIIVSTAIPSDYSQKVLIEDYTGTWCGNCPRVSYAITQLKEQSDQIVSVAVHLYEANDDYTFDGSIVLNEAFEIGGLPEGRLNRINFWQSPQQNNLGQALDYTGLNAPLGLAINSEINNNTINATVVVGFSETYTTNLGVVVYLVENGLIHDQVNYTDDLYGAGNVDPLLNFEHNDVLRAIYTDHFGDAIPSTNTIENEFYTLNLEKTIPGSIENTDNLHLVAFVVNKDTNEVINVQEAAIGENKEFD